MAEISQNYITRPEADHDHRDRAISLDELKRRVLQMAARPVNTFGGNLPLLAPIPVLHAARVIQVGFINFKRTLN